MVSVAQRDNGDVLYGVENGLSSIRYAPLLCAVLTVESSFIEDNLKFNLDNRFALGSGLLRNSTWDKTWSLIKRTGSCLLSRSSLSNLKGCENQINKLIPLMYN